MCVPPLWKALFDWQFALLYITYNLESLNVCRELGDKTMIILSIRFILQVKL